MSEGTDINQRKKDHIDLALQSQILEADDRFYYEPAIHGHPNPNLKLPFQLANQQMDFPIWVSSMTGGAKIAQEINTNLAKACAKFKLGMGLGSCRVILDDDTYLKDFQVRKFIDNQPLYANLGIAQIEYLIQDNQLGKIKELLTKTEADGLIIHINPLQEWLQPNGDRYYQSPIDSIKKVLDYLDAPVIVKEVGQGFGPKSIEALLNLPLEALDFGAHGGTNFSKVELLRHDNPRLDALSTTVNLGHHASQMCDLLNLILDKGDFNPETRNIIVSGGVSSYLDGYYYTKRIPLNAMYGQASAMLKYAQIGYEPLEQFIQGQVEGLQLAAQFLTVK
jgi:isopentenyl-diphosphate delta-isomerase